MDQERPSGRVVSAKKQWLRQRSFNTRQLHYGQEPDPTTKALAVPIMATTSYDFETSARGARLFKFDEDGYAYTRMANPTVGVFERRVCSLEGGVAAVGAASGHSAQMLALMSLASAGDNIISTSYLYGGTHSQFKFFLPRFGVKVKIVSGDDPKDFEPLIDDKTKAIYIESIGNPGMNVPDFEAFTTMAHKYGVPVVVDNTFGAGGYLVRPFEHGVDIVVHSATKWIGGHGTTLGGVVVDSGNFDWKKHAKRFPDFTEPAPGYHGMSFVGRFGKRAYATRVRIEALRDLGCALNPFAAFQLLQGLETLSLRVDRTCQNALALAQWLDKSDKVAWVNYPGLTHHKSHHLAKKYLPRGFGGVLSFGIKGGIAAGMKVLDNFKMVCHVGNVGDSKTLALHPWSTTHEQMSDADKVKGGVMEDLIRCSVGTEQLEDIIADFEQAFAAAATEIAATPKPKL